MLSTLLVFGSGISAAIAALQISSTSPTSGGTSPLCMTTESNNDGALVSLAACDRATDTLPAGNRTWVYLWSRLAGPIKTYSGTKCLNVRSGADSDGTALQIWTCVQGSPNQKFVVDDNLQTITWYGRNKCVDITNENLAPGNHLQIWGCNSSNDNQKWATSEIV
ncbi:hypothetical protein PQX77_001950 [Marasmius sp. AFHP31]|nr:hypothetical protein PQX77_001950 [Marasmius sp. AFHP31]